MNTILNDIPALPEDNMLPESAFYEDSGGLHCFPLRTLHLYDGRIFIRGEINSETAMSFASAMLHLSKENEPVRIYINSGGGEVGAGLMMYDIMRDYRGTVETFCIGTAASMAAVLFAAGQKGHRFILPHSRVMIHEPLLAGGFGGSATTIEKTAKSILEVRSTLNGIIAEHTGHTVEEVNKATESDYWMDAKQAIEFGICDKINSIF